MTPIVRLIKQTQSICLVAFVLLSALGLSACDRQPKLSKLAPDAVILAFGDSLTYGTGAAPGHDYPSILAQQIAHPVINAGIAGEISADGLARLPALLDEHQPKLLILIHGGNDILRRLDPKQTEQNLIAMISAAKQRGIGAVLLAVPDLNLTLSSAALYKSVAETTKTPLDNDAVPQILRKAELKADQVHPNAAGYQQLAERVASLLKQSGAL